MSRNYHLSARAFESLEAIRQYSMQQFGYSQTVDYLHDLTEMFELLASRPQMGKQQQRLHADYYTHPYGSHMLYYEIQSDHIYIIDILHQSMNPLAHLDD